MQATFFSEEQLTTQYVLCPLQRQADCCKDEMQKGNSSNVNLPAESSLLVNALLNVHLHSHGGLSEEDEGVRNIDWVPKKDFTVEEGKRQIGEYIQTWQLGPSWLHSLDFLCSHEMDGHSLYHFQARFSQPSQANPIVGTASVFFSIGVSNLTEETEPVDVLFIIESNQRVQMPGRTRFIEKWLLDVIESKDLLRGLMMSSF